LDVKKHREQHSAFGNYNVVIVLLTSQNVTLQKIIPVHGRLNQRILFNCEVALLLRQLFVAWWHNRLTIKRFCVRLLSGHYQVVTTWTVDCLWIGKLSQYIANTEVNSAFPSFGVGKLSTVLPGWG